MRLLRSLVCFGFVAASASLWAQSTACSVQAAVPIPAADTAFAAGEFGRAEELYSGALGSAPEAAAVGLVRAQLEQHKVLEAVGSARAAVAAQPGSAAAQALLGTTLLRAGQVTEATGPLGKALTLGPCSARALFGLATYNGLISKRASAATQLASAHRLAPSDAEITAAWAVTLGPDAEAAALKALLAGAGSANAAVLAPAEVARLGGLEALAEGHKSCTAAWPAAPVKVDLWGITTYGTHARGFGIKLRVGATEIPTAELDTGVSGIVLNPHDAKAAGVHPVGAATALPGTSWYYAVVDTVRVGGVEFHDCPVRVATSDALGGANSLIGTDFFRDRVMRIDYIDRSLTLTAPAVAAAGVVDRTVPAAEKDWSVAYIAGENVLLPTLINKKGPYLMLLSTGSFTSVYAPVIGDAKPVAYKDTLVPLRGMSADIVKVVPQLNGGDPNTARVFGPGGNRLGIGIPVKQPDLRFYANSALDVDPVSFDIGPKSAEVGLELAGLLGFPVLQNYTIEIDYRNGLVHLIYDTQHRYADRELGRQQ